MYNEIHQLEEWFHFVKQIADGGILIVDTGSKDGTIEYATKQGAIVIIDDIIIREGYGPARNHLRMESRKHFPNAHWMIYLDADERIDAKEFHRLRFIKDYLRETFDVVALPRIDWMDKERTAMAKDWTIFPDWQARMTRLNSPMRYVRKLHEQIVDFRGIYTNLRTPKINHFHRSASRDKRDYIGRVCAKLHMEDSEYGETYPMHHKEQFYRDQLEKEGLGGPEK
jgi:glycosyltransferase involved in cell wall biosynthesis